MIKNSDATHACGIMSRLLKNEEGNIIAILAAAVIPVIGLVGGALDMSRLYLTQARLQGACDAGALIGPLQGTVRSLRQESAQAAHGAPA